MSTDVFNLEIGLLLLAVVLLVAANGFFVAAEFALVSVRRTRIDQLANEGNRRARVVGRSLDDLDSYIAATQLGITMASLGLGWIGEPALARVIDPLFESLLGHNAGVVSASVISFAIAFSLVTLLHIVFGELAPKSLALQRAEATSMWVAAPLRLFLRLFRPIIVAMNGLGRIVVRPFGLEASAGHASVLSEEELRMLIVASTQGGALAASEQDIIHRAFVFADDTAADVMLPRTELVGLSLGAGAAELRRLLAEHRLERYPVYEGDSDHIVGILHARDALAALTATSSIGFDLAATMRPALNVPTSLPLDRLLDAMRRARTHGAVAVDEFGGTAGMIDLERVVERLVGPLPDEFSQRAPAAGDAGGTTFDGLTLVQDVNERRGLRLDEERARTIGGLIFYELGRTPNVGDSVVLAGVRLTVTGLDGLRIAAVRVEVADPDA